MTVSPLLLGKTWFLSSAMTTVPSKEENVLNHESSPLVLCRKYESPLVRLGRRPPKSETRYNLRTPENGSKLDDRGNRDESISTQ
jgi:hypothetical protein